jgi:myo-inositol-1(or 4)-monophosphatase
MAAGILLVREAGGFATDLDDRDDMLKKGHMLAGNETVHMQLLRLLTSAND